MLHTTHRHSHSTPAAAPTTNASVFAVSLAIQRTRTPVSPRPPRHVACYASQRLGPATSSGATAPSTSRCGSNPIHTNITTRATVAVMCLPQVTPCEPIHIQQISYHGILTHIKSGVADDDNHHGRIAVAGPTTHPLLIVPTSLALCTVAAAATMSNPSRRCTKHQPRETCTHHDMQPRHDSILRRRLLSTHPTTMTIDVQPASNGSTAEP
jgi:hypothetical protein